MNFILALLLLSCFGSGNSSSRIVVNKRPLGSRPTSRLNPFLAVAAIIIMAIGAQAQVKPFVGASVEGVRGLGYTNPGFIFTGGVEENGKRFLFIQRATVFTANKIETGNGTQVSLAALGFVRQPVKDIALLYGGGVEGSRLFTSRWTKDAAKPLAGFGIEIPDRMRFLALYQFGGHDYPSLRLLKLRRLLDFDPHNHVHGARLEVEFRVGKGFWITHEQRVLAFHATDQPGARLNGYEISAGAKYVFRK